MIFRGCPVISANASVKLAQTFAQIRTNSGQFLDGRARGVLSGCDRSLWGAVRNRLSILVSARCRVSGGRCRRLLPPSGRIRCRSAPVSPCAVGDRRQRPPISYRTAGGQPRRARIDRASMLLQWPNKPAGCVLAGRFDITNMEGCEGNRFHISRY